MTDINGDSDVVRPNRPAEVSALSSPDSSISRQSPTASSVAERVPEGTDHEIVLHDVDHAPVGQFDRAQVAVMLSTRPTT